MIGKIARLAIVLNYIIPSLITKSLFKIIFLGVNEIYRELIEFIEKK